MNIVDIMNLSESEYRLYVEKENAETRAFVIARIKANMDRGFVKPEVMA